MSSGPVRLWDADKRAAYMRSVDDAEARWDAERAGKPVAERLDELWGTLFDAEREVIQYLLSLESRSAVGNCDDPALMGLCGHGLLQLPPGVRPALRQDLQTTFTVPAAVWDSLKKQHARFMPYAGDELLRYQRESAAKFADRLKPIGAEQNPSETAHQAVPSVSAITRATLLLCCRLGEAHDGPRGLSPSEYHDLAEWLERRRASLSDLLRPDGKILLRAYSGKTSLLQRMTLLLRREAEMERAIEQWTRSGIWVVAERDPVYPFRLHQRLKTMGLPLLFGAGPRQNLDQGGLGIVGSRDSSESARKFARDLASRCGHEGLTVITSEMRGVDREAITAALKAGGRVICVLSDSLKKVVATKRFQEALATGRLHLITPFPPDTHFKIANAMRAHRYQYCLADAVVIVETRQKGGIWSGAEENRKEGWVPAFVRVDKDASSGNMALVHLGLHPLSWDEIADSPSLTGFFLARTFSNLPPTAAAAEPCQPAAEEKIDLFAFFMQALAPLLADAPLSEAAIALRLDLEPAQARAWLARAAKDGRVAVDGDPPLYRAKT